MGVPSGHDIASRHLYTGWAEAVCIANGKTSAMIAIKADNNFILLSLLKLACLILPAAEAGGSGQAGQKGQVLYRAVNFIWFSAVRYLSEQ
jgi:hypothetical protein